MYSKKHLSFNALRKLIADQFNRIEDIRQSGKVDYRLHDCLMSVLAMMFLQDPSLLAFQRRLQSGMQKNNLKTIYQIDAIPSDTQIRSILDTVDTDQLEPIFAAILHRLQRGKHLEDYRIMDGRYLLSIDGSEYFSSSRVHCPGCLKTQHQKGPIRYHHQILQAVMVHPDKRHVLPLAPEAISNRDGRRKQDCEINAAKRMLPKIRKAHPKLNLMITADGLYSKQPFIDALKKNRMSFILVAKPTDHKTLFEWVHELLSLDDGGQLEFADQKGRSHRYQWVNQVPLNGTANADLVHFFQYHLIRDGKVTYKNSWVTDIKIGPDNVVTLVKAGRARWKIENETFNTLKNQGYHIEHNFGHGRQHLSMNFFVLNLLAFYIHQVLEYTDTLYHRVRYTKFTSRREFFNQLRCTLRVLIFPHWDSLLQFILDPYAGIPP